MTVFGRHFLFDPITKPFQISAEAMSSHALPPAIYVEALAGCAPPLAIYAEALAGYALALAIRAEALVSYAPALAIHAEGLASCPSAMAGSTIVLAGCPLQYKRHHFKAHGFAAVIFKHASYCNSLLILITGKTKVCNAVPWKRVSKTPLDVE